MRLQSGKERGINLKVLVVHSVNISENGPGENKWHDFFLLAIKFFDKRSDEDSSTPCFQRYLRNNLMEDGGGTIDTFNFFSSIHNAETDLSIELTLVSLQRGSLQG